MCGSAMLDPTPTSARPRKRLLHALLGVLSATLAFPLACGDDGGSSQLPAAGATSSDGGQAPEGGSGGKPSGGSKQGGSNQGGSSMAGSSQAGMSNEAGISSGGGEPVAGAANAPNDGGAGAGGAGGATPDGASAGAGGSGGEPSVCQDVLEDAGCADANAATVDGQSALFGGCMHINQVSPGVGSIAYESFGVDIATGLAFAQKGSGTSDHDGIVAACAALTVQGVSGWRLPTIDEARLLAGGCAPTAPGGTCPLKDPSCLGKDCGFAMPACESCIGNMGPHKTKGYCRPEVPLCINLTTSSACPDCGAAGYWTYSIINGNFYSAAPNAGGFIVCVKDDVPGAVPCDL